MVPTGSRQEIPLVYGPGTMPLDQEQPHPAQCQGADIFSPAEEGPDAGPDSGREPESSSRRSTPSVAFCGPSREVRLARAPANR